MQEALIEGEKELRGSVNITFSASAENAARPWESIDDWTKFRNDRLDDTKLNIHFMRNFAEFITQQIHL